MIDRFAFVEIFLEGGIIVEIVIRVTCNGLQIKPLLELTAATKLHGHSHQHVCGSAAEVCCRADWTLPGREARLLGPSRTT